MSNGFPQQPMQQMMMPGYGQPYQPQMMQQPGMQQMFQPQQGVPTADRINQLGAQMAALDEQYKQLKQQTYSAQPQLQQMYQQAQPQQPAPSGFVEVAVASYEQAREFTITPENLNNRYILTDAASRKMYLKYYDPNVDGGRAVFKEYQEVEPNATGAAETPPEQPEPANELQSLRDKLTALEGENKALRDRLIALEEKINDSRITGSTQQPNGSDVDGKQPAVKSNTPRRKSDGESKSVA